MQYLPAESDTGMFGGNSNWRGPVWFPVNTVMIRVLLQYHLYYGDDFRIECPTGSGKRMNLFEVSREIADRLTRIFLRDPAGNRPVYGGAGSSRPTRTGVIHPVLRILPRRQRRRPRRYVTRRVGRGWLRA